MQMKDWVPLVFALLFAACREGGDGDIDADIDAAEDAEVELDSDADGEPDADNPGCPSACGEVDCSGRGVCDMDLNDCTPYCWCWVGYHPGGEDGLECLPD